jgi:hypothetical protein
MLVAILCNKYKTVWNCLAAMGFIWIAMFYLILGSDLGLIIYLHEKIIIMKITTTIFTLLLLIFSNWLRTKQIKK